MLPESSLSLSTAYPVWLLILAILLAAGFSYWSYLRTLPPTRRWLRLLLASLRWCAIIGGILLLAQPVIEIHRTSHRPADVLVLVDKSASMGLLADDRLHKLEDMLTGSPFRRIGDEFSLRLFSFTDSLDPEYGDVRKLIETPPTGVGTDLGGAWMKALEQYSIDRPAVILLITDGVHNRGTDPARMARITHVPIWSVGIGSSEAMRDLMIRSVSVSPVVYQGSRVPVEVGYRGVGAAGTTTSLVMRDTGGKRLSSRTVRFGGDFSEETLMFEIPVDSPGRYRYSVEIERLDGELTYDNNRRSFYLNVLKNRMRVLIMAGLPDQGLGDLVRRLRRDDNIEIILRTTAPAQKGGAGFYEGGWPDDELLDRTDVVILHHFPVRSNRIGSLESFAAKVLEKELPVGFIEGGKISVRGIKLFDNVLPVTLNRTRVRVRRGQVLPVKRHGVTADPDAADITAGWAEMPPVTFGAEAFTVKPQASVLAEFTEEGSGKRYPAIAVQETGGTKSAAILIRDLWRWGLAGPGDEGIVEPLLHRLVRWLAVRKTDKRVKVIFDKELFSNQEPVGFAVTVLDENYLPLDGVDVAVEVSRDGDVGGQATLEGLGQGRYRGSFHSWGEGEYNVAVEARLDGEQIGKDRGRITVEPFSIELLDTWLNEQLLRAIGEASGGGYVPIDSADSLFGSFDFPMVDSEEVRKIRLWGRGWLLACIIGLLTIEWFIRVRVGML